MLQPEADIVTAGHFRRACASSLIFFVGRRKADGGFIRCRAYENHPSHTRTAKSRPFFPLQAFGPGGKIMLPQKAALIRLCPELGLGRMKGRPASNSRTIIQYSAGQAFTGFFNFRKPDWNNIMDGVLYLRVDFEGGRVNGQKKIFPGKFTLYSGFGVFSK